MPEGIFPFAGAHALICPCTRRHSGKDLYIAASEESPRARRVMNRQILQYIVSFSTIRSYHYTPFATGYFVKIREKLDAWQTRVKSSDATQTLDDQPLANSGIYSTLYKLSSYASSTHSHVRPLYHLYRSCPSTVTLN